MSGGCPMLTVPILRLVGGAGSSQQHRNVHLLHNSSQMFQPQKHKELQWQQQQQQQSMEQDRLLVARDQVAANSKDVGDWFDGPNFQQEEIGGVAFEMSPVKSNLDCIEPESVGTSGKGDRRDSMLSPGKVTMKKSHHHHPHPHHHVNSRRSISSRRALWVDQTSCEEPPTACQQKWSLQFSPRKGAGCGDDGDDDNHFLWEHGVRDHQEIQINCPGTPSQPSLASTLTCSLALSPDFESSISVAEESSKTALSMQIPAPRLWDVDEDSTLGVCHEWDVELSTEAYYHKSTKGGGDKEEVEELPSQSCFRKLESMDEWDYECLDKEWMASLLGDFTGDSITSRQQQGNGECTPPFTPGLPSSSQWRCSGKNQISNSSTPSDHNGEENECLEYLQVEVNPVRNHCGEEIGEELVTLLLACAEAVSTKSLILVNHLLEKLGHLASPKGTALQRVAAYFTEGLACRVAHLWPQIYKPLPPNLRLNEEEMQAAYHLLNHVSPFTKFAHFTANDIIMQAFEGADRVHVIDFDIKQGLQWPALFQSLAVRDCGPPSHIRITGVGDCKEELQDTGDRLAEFAQFFNIPFVFHEVIDRLEDIRLWMLHVKEDEVIAVNCITQLHRMLYDSGETIKDFLGLIDSTKPKVVAIVEQEGSHNGPHFEGRFLESLKYYSAIFDCLESNLPQESEARVQVEQLFAQEIGNILACEGAERVERHEGINRWRTLMGEACFVNEPVKESAQTQAQILLRMFQSDGFTLVGDNGALTLGWMDQPLFTASAWKPDKSIINCLESRTQRTVLPMTRLYPPTRAGKPRDHPV